MASVVVAASAWWLVAVAPAGAEVNPGPSYLSADDTTDSYDESGVSWVGTPSYAAGRSGAAGDRAFVVGPSGVLTANDPDVGNFGTADFTLNLHVQLAPEVSARTQILSKRAGCLGGSFLDLRAGTQFGGVYFEIQDVLNFGFNVLNPANVFDGAWHQITARRSGTLVSLTVDGVTTSATSNGVVNIDNAEPMRFGDGGCVTGPGNLGDTTTRASGRLDAISFGPGAAIVGPPASPTDPPPPPSTSPAPPAPGRPGAPTTSAPNPSVVPSSPPGAGPSTGDSRSTASGPGRPTRPADGTTTTPTGPDSTESAAPPAPPADRSAARPGADTASPPSLGAGAGFVASLPGPGDVRTDAATLVESALLAILLLTLLALPIGIINDTATGNAPRFAAMAARVPRIRELVVVSWTERLRFTIGLALAAVVGAVIYGFVQPAFGFDLSSLALVVGFVVAFLVVSATKELAQFAFLRQAYDIRGFLRLFPAFALVGVACVTVSRAVGLQPGLILGTLASLGVPAGLDVERKGRAIAVASGALALLCLLAWTVRSAVVADGPPDGFIATSVSVALTAIAVATAEHLVFGLVPLSFLDGWPLYRWSRAAWAGFSAVGAFAFVHVLLQRDASDFADRAAHLLVLLLIYLATAAAFWAWFRFRPAREPLPPVADPEDALT